MGATCCKNGQYIRQNDETNDVSHLSSNQPLQGSRLQTSQQQSESSELTGIDKKPSITRFNEKDQHQEGGGFSQRLRYNHLRFWTNHSVPYTSRKRRQATPANDASGVDYGSSARKMPYRNNTNCNETNKDDEDLTKGKRRRSHSASLDRQSTCAAIEVDDLPDEDNPYCVNYVPYHRPDDVSTDHRSTAVQCSSDEVERPVTTTSSSLSPSSQRVRQDSSLSTAASTDGDNHGHPSSSGRRHQQAADSKSNSDKPSDNL